MEQYYATQWMHKEKGARMLSQVLPHIIWIEPTYRLALPMYAQRAFPGLQQKWSSREHDEGSLQIGWILTTSKHMAFPVIF